MHTVILSFTKLWQHHTNTSYLAFTVCNQAVKGKPGYKVWIQNIFQNQTGWIPAAGGPCRGAGLWGVTHQGKNGLCTCQVVGHLVHPEATVELKREVTLVSIHYLKTSLPAGDITTLKKNK